jgi:hypothetical protein
MKTSLLRYKIGLGIFVLLTIGLAGLVLIQAVKTKQDATTVNAANNVADTVNDYVMRQNVVPVSLKQAGVRSAPQTLSYRKISADRYTFCVTYKTTSSGFDPTAAVVSLATSGSIDTNSDISNDSPELTIPSTHHKGTNCQTIKPYITQATTYFAPQEDPQQQAKTSGAQDDACGMSGYGTHYSGTIITSKTSDGSPVIPTADQTFIATIKASGTTPSGEQTLTMPEDFNAFDGSCTTIDHASIQPGDAVSVFADNTEPNMPNALIDFSQNQ